MRVFATSIRDAADSFLHAGYISALGHTRDRLTENQDIATALADAQVAAPATEVASTPAAAAVTDAATTPAAAAVTEVANEAIATGVAETAGTAGSVGLVEWFVTGGWWMPELALALTLATAVAVLCRPRPYRASNRTIRVMAAAAIPTLTVGLLAVGTMAMMLIRAI